MSNKSAAQTISLPKGGGALHGIGEKFAPDLHTGTGNFTVPIALPPGRNGFQPQLNLVYSTGHGNGPFGLGWNLSIPGISRKTSKGIPRYDDATDTFILSGAEDLVPVPGGQGRATRYRPRTEGLFARIEHFVNAAMQDDHWEVRSKDGLISCYGTAKSIGTDLAVTTKPADPAKVFAWKLTETRDPFDNVIEYEYLRDEGQDGPHEWSQPLLKQVRYVDFPEGGQIEFLITVTLEYEDRLDDAFSEYRSGFEIRTTKRCNRIVVRTHAGADRLVRTYDLIYLDQRADPANPGDFLPIDKDAARPNLEDLLPINRVSLLSCIKVTGHNGMNTEELPPLEFRYTRFTPVQTREFFPISGPELPPFSLAHPDYELVDLIGNGLPDVLEMNGSVRYWRNLGGGQFDLPREMAEAPAGLRLAEPGVQMIDADGDGRLDLVVTTPAITGYFPLQFGALWNKDSFRRWEAAPSFNLEDPEVRLVDLDGDGITDVIRSGTRFESYFNEQHRGWTAENASRVERQPDLDLFPDINFSDSRVKWADMTGDGLQDIALIHDGSVEYWPNLGRGKWGKRIVMRNSPRLPLGYDPKRILVGDVDGDGLADVVYVEDTQITLWINRSGNAWSDPITILGTPPVTDMDSVRLADMLGSGVSGVLWSSDAGGLSHETMFFLDFTGGPKPYVLSEMNNHMGAVTKVGYKSSTHFYLEDEKKAETRWKTPLPFPVQVVAQVEVIDEISRGKLTTVYRYKDGYWDGGEREFRGFAMVEHRDTQDFVTFNAPGLHRETAFEEARESFSPPTLTKTWFHGGPVGEEFGEWKELDHSDEFWPGDRPMLQRPSTTQALLEGLPRRAVRDAIRTFRGSILRTELYALDGSARQDRPYTITESQYALYEVLEENGLAKLSTEASLTDSPDNIGPPGFPAESARIFFPHVVAQRTTQWERGDDPMTQLNFTEKFDNFGQAQTAISIACPRRWKDLDSRPGEPFLATKSETQYAAPEKPASFFIYDRVAGIKTHEIEGTAGKTVLEVKDSNNLNLFGHVIHYYDGEDAFVGLPYQQVGNYGALVRTETLVLTEDIVRDGYESDNAADPEAPPYLLAGDPLPDEYPLNFSDRLPPLAGYTKRESGFFAQTERRKYDFQIPAASRRGLMMATQDPLAHETTIEYEPYGLLPAKVTDPVGLATVAEYDYRVMQPKIVTDPNGNQTEFVFSELGLLKETWVKGKKANEGDQHDASVKMKYGFLAFLKSPPDAREPIFVHTIRRCYHDTDVGIVDEQKRNQKIETREFSDGFGRLVQTRTQAEDELFGNESFGGDVLPDDQTDNVGTKAAVLGRANRPPADPNAPFEPNVVVSGWQSYDNKGQVVEKFEPFFSTGWDYRSPEQERTAFGREVLGQKVTMFYDPRGYAIRTVNPDGSEQRVIYGAPGTIAAPDIDNPDVFEPTPWETYTYDANDNAGRTHAVDSESYKEHWNTPASALVDALGRTIQTVERNRALHENPADPLAPVEEYRTRSTYDIRGNLTKVNDQLQRDAFEYVYDFANQPLRTKNIDAGIRRTVRDAGGNVIEQRDSKGALILRQYDKLNRPIKMWARNDGNADSAMTLREQLEYGNDPAIHRDHNRLGKLHKHYDEAGLLTFEEYDFKGNLLEKVRQVISDDAILDVVTPEAPDRRVKEFSVDWEPAGAAAALLAATEYRISTSYDALNRAKRMLYPKDVEDNRKELLPIYNRSGALQSVQMGGDIYVQRIAYNAKGQRTLIAYGNGVMTRYAYDEHTFRLTRLRSEKYVKAGGLHYEPDGRVFQDFAYDYDLAGNILRIRDRTPKCGVRNAALGIDALDREFRYDPLSRLLSATGRECKNIPQPRPWTDEPRCGFQKAGQPIPNPANAPDLTALYTEEYYYDPAGNMLKMRHSTGDGAWTRHFGMGGLSPDAWKNEWEAHLAGPEKWDKSRGNRLTHVGDNQPGTPQTHFFDSNGNLLRENTERHFEWDHSDRMRGFRVQRGGARPSVQAQYIYDHSGQRTMKLVMNGKLTITIYIEGIFEHHRQITAGGLQQSNFAHVIDDQQRIVMLRSGDLLDGDADVTISYRIGDHLGNGNVVIDAAGAFVNREEYTPFGETSFGSFARKRYRFSDKERDDESGLSYHNARFFAPWLARWVSCDAGGMSDGLNTYWYVKNRPVNLRDPNGQQSETSPNQPTQNEQVPTPSGPSPGAKSNGSYSSLLFQIGTLPQLVPVMAFLNQFHVPTKEDVQNYAKGAITGALEGLSPISLVPPGEHTERFQTARSTFRAFFSLGGSLRPNGGPKNVPSPSFASPSWNGGRLLQMEAMTKPLADPYLLMAAGRQLHASATALKGKGTGGKPLQEHHHLTNKTIKGGFSDFFAEIVKPLGLTLKGKWNVEKLPHQGGHPLEFREWMLGQVMEIVPKAKGNQMKFLRLFEHTKEIVRNNPAMLYKDFWRN